MKSVFWAAMTIFMLSTSSASARSSHDGLLKKGMPFQLARSLLIKQGWRPVNIHQHDDYAFMGIETEWVKAGFSELDSCAVDRASCIANYRKAKQCLKLQTAGEDIKHMRIDSWTGDCVEVGK